MNCSYEPSVLHLYSIRIKMLNHVQYIVMQISMSREKTNPIEDKPYKWHSRGQTSIERSPWERRTLWEDNPLYKGHSEREDNPLYKGYSERGRPSLWRTLWEDNPRYKGHFERTTLSMKDTQREDNPLYKGHLKRGQPSLWRTLWERTDLFTGHSERG